MKASRSYPAYTVNKKAEASLVAGHPWLYENDILAQPETPPDNGALVDLVSPKGAYLGTGLLSLHSKIRVRLISRNANDAFDAAFWKRRIEYAWAYRKTVLRPEDLSACRIIFGEADQFPGLTVDRFGPILVTQTLSVGMERLKPVVFPLLAEVLRADGQQIDGIYERNDEALRAKEGLEQNKGWFPLPGETPPPSTRTEICENGVYYHVDFENGQKTGFFLDQKYNRQAVARLAAGHTVLDCFTHTGSFALNAAKGGAARVTAADISADAIAMARRNAQRNGLTNMDFLCEDTFELLPRLEKEGSPYDFIILDPPAFTKARRTVENAMRGYKEINYRAMKLLPRGGYLATASCSHFATEELFIKMLRSAAKDAHRQLRQIEVRQQAPDHPILWGVPETNYLKFFLFQVI
ncbi:MAG: class I SAM-dependent rRNA methyltransferase [Candidatus Faecalibacterium intestinavium]|uniref:Class I SAM-dependent rRNA methyltransferase n=1 Tax=Candidatus Faecalibacterium intestinavium TaxID=2838580 RepID=A0A9E2NPZ3_9FIRM|nr:class I SAM-dependent rRNA methyltransferase [Candidatus Faecalibacterium intestinavium]